jgi:hypothetical protein
MAYFLFTNPGETAILVSYKKEELGTTCFYNTYIYHGLETKADLAGYFKKKKSMEGHEQKRELLMKKQQPPPPVP